MNSSINEPDQHKHIEELAGRPYAMLCYAVLCYAMVKNTQSLSVGRLSLSLPPTSVAFNPSSIRTFVVRRAWSLASVQRRAAGAVPVSCWTSSNVTSYLGKSLAGPTIRGKQTGAGSPGSAKRGRSESMDRWRKDRNVHSHANMLTMEPLARLCVLCLHCMPPTPYGYVHLCLRFWSSNIMVERRLRLLALVFAPEASKTCHGLQTRK